MAKVLDKFSNRKKLKKEETETEESSEEFDEIEEEEDEEEAESDSEIDDEDEEEDDDDDDDDDDSHQVKKTKKEEKIEREQDKISNLKNTIKDELSQMSFEERVKFQNKLGLKKFNQMINQESLTNPERKTFKRLNKNRPQEFSSKRPVSSFRSVFQIKKKEVIDPRFNSAFGEYKPEFFRKRYGFVNDMRLRDKEQIVEQLKNEKDPKKREQIKSALTRLKQQIKSFEESKKQEEMKEKIKKQVMEDAKEGKRPHFVNKSEQKILELAEKYKELKKSGKVENYLAKKRKRQLGKDSKHLHKSNQHLQFK